MIADSQFTTTELLAAATDLLLGAGYQRVEDRTWGSLLGSNSRLFEDPYGILAIVAYDTWADLSSHWVDAQGLLVELISKYVPQAEAKAWDGYLVLLTPSILRGDARQEVMEIRYDTNRVRKLVATGEELKALVDLQTVLLPVLPLGAAEVPTQVSALDVLPRVLARKGISQEAVDVLVRAFSNQESLMERLHEYRTKT